VVWDEEERVVPAYASGGDPLLGMKLLREHLLTLELVRGGAITVAPPRLRRPPGAASRWRRPRGRDGNGATRPA
jgi:hypothetical protein